MTKTVAIISDTHAYLDPQIAEIIRVCDYAIHAGDICGESVLSAMQPKSGKVVAVAGNNDAYCHEAGDQLPDVMELQINGEKIAVEHGHVHGMHTPCHESLRKTHTDAKVIVYGHTHKQVIDQDALPWVINPGAAGATRTRGGPSCLVLECHSDREWEIKTYRFEEKLIA